MAGGDGVRGSHFYGDHDAALNFENLKNLKKLNS
jgi:hypothetical protein